MVRVTDKGVGFQAGQEPEKGRYGLRIIQERAESMGWRLTVSSRPGKTTLDIEGGD
ncbi:nitrate/nitrite sensor protein NarQ [compost metagenome]